MGACKRCHAAITGAEKNKLASLPAGTLARGRNGLGREQCESTAVLVRGAEFELGYVMHGDRN